MPSFDAESCVSFVSLSRPPFLLLFRSVLGFLSFFVTLAVVVVMVVVVVVGGCVGAVTKAKLKIKSKFLLASNFFSFQNKTYILEIPNLGYNVYK